MKLDCFCCCKVMLLDPPPPYFCVPTERLQQNISHTMADESIKLLSSKHDDKNSRYIQLQDLDHSHHPRSGPTDVVPTAPTSPSEITDAITSGQDGENGEKEKTNSSMTLAQKLTFWWDGNHILDIFYVSLCTCSIFPLRGKYT